MSLLRRTRSPLAVTALLVACWLPSMLAGGEASLPPLALALPGLYAAVRFGLGATLAVSLAAGLLAGPGTPVDNYAATSQETLAWMFRAGFFVVLSLVARRFVQGLKHETARYRALARVDPLTGIANRTMLEEQLGYAVDAAAAANTGVVLAYLDLDDFKTVNDSLGHAAGDELLANVAGRLRSCARGSDLVARQGGDEFLFLLENVRPGLALPLVKVLFERVQAALSEPFVVAGAELLVGASMGVSFFPDDATSAAMLRQHADAAMYRAKQSGSSWAVYDESTVAPTARLTLAAKLRRAVEADELELHYQPAVRLADGAILGVEALVRWRTADGLLVPPADFIPVAEETGVIDAVGAWVLEELCGQAWRWNDAGLHPNLGINVSPRELRRVAFAERFAERIAHHGLDPRRFVVELTESAWAIESERTLPVVHALRAAGLSLALDDFGAGYSSLARLLELPVDVIKVDRSLLAGVPERASALAVFEAIRRLADACGCDVVAEGIETTAQRDVLERLGCQLGQGFGLARPADAATTTQRLRAGLAPERQVLPTATTR